MIKEFEYLHGVVLTRLCAGATKGIRIQPFKSTSNSTFVINDSVGLFIKYSGKRLTPWRFTMSTEQISEFNEIRQSCNEVFTCLVCYLDGVAVLNTEELTQVFDLTLTNGWLAVARKKNRMYSVSGSTGPLGHKVGKSDCPKRIHDFLEKFTTPSLLKS